MILNIEEIERVYKTLKECPFCGSKGEISQYMDVLGIYQAEVGCSNTEGDRNCGVSFSGDSVFECVERWSKRIGDGED